LLRLDPAEALAEMGGGGAGEFRRGRNRVAEGKNGTIVEKRAGERQCCQRMPLGPTRVVEILLTVVCKVISLLKVVYGVEKVFQEAALSCWMFSTYAPVLSGSVALSLAESGAFGTHLAHNKFVTSSSWRATEVKGEGRRLNAHSRLIGLGAYVRPAIRHVKRIVIVLGSPPATFCCPLTPRLRHQPCDTTQYVFYLRLKFRIGIQPQFDEIVVIVDSLFAVPALLVELSQALVDKG
jgi:hypothetical protein